MVRGVIWPDGVRHANSRGNTNKIREGRISNMNQSKRIATFNRSSRRVVTIFNFEWEEYQCLLYIDGNLYNKATYHTSDKRDALLTAKEMVK